MAARLLPGVGVGPPASGQAATASARQSTPYSGARLLGLGAIGGGSLPQNLHHRHHRSRARILPSPPRVLERDAPSQQQQMRSSAERFIEEALLAAEQEAGNDADADDAEATATKAGAAPLASPAQLADLRARLAEAEARLARADADLDGLYARAFAAVREVQVEKEEEAEGSDGTGDDRRALAKTTTTTRTVTVPQPMSARAFSALSRDDPAAADALLSAVQSQPQQPQLNDGGDSANSNSWRALQPLLATARLARGRAEREAEALRARAEDAVRGRAMAAAEGKRAGGGGGGGSSSSNGSSSGGRGAAPAPAKPAPATTTTAEVVLVCGFESFNVALYRQVARRLASRPDLSPQVRLTVYSDRDLADDASGGRRAEVAAALSRADCAFCSLLFDYDAVEWLRPLLASVPQVLVFESALELMSCTRLGGFKMGGGGDGGAAAAAADGSTPAPSAPPKKAGPPPAVKKVMSLFSSGREEDRMVGYLAFLKAGPQLLKFVPGKTARDLRCWLTVYGYWNQGGAGNVEAMIEFLGREYLGVGDEGGGGGAAPSAAVAAATAALSSSSPSPSAAGGGLLAAFGRFVAETTRGALPPGERRASVGAAATFSSSSSSAAYAPPPPLETPATGCLHPDYPPPPPAGAPSSSPSSPSSPYFATPADYVLWYAREGPLRARLPPSVVAAAAAGVGGSGQAAAVAAAASSSSSPTQSYAPVVAVLLYRKHVITEQAYIPQLVRLMEAEGVIPVPIFINGVEAHTVVRDALTSAREQRARARKKGSGGAAAGAGGVGGLFSPAFSSSSSSSHSSSSSSDHYHDYEDAFDAESDDELFNPTLSPAAVPVDAVVNTIGFPLVGGPAGTMEGGRQAEVAAAILRSKGVPYVVAAPLLIQSMEQWSRDGVAGLQSVVLYALPELDGATDAIPLGGLVGDDIFLAPERVRKLAGRLRRWHALRTKKTQERRVAVLTYGFPPGVGSVGTAALLNVPKSLVASLKALRNQGYDLGGVELDAMGEMALRADVAGVASSALIGEQRKRDGGGGGDGSAASLSSSSPADPPPPPLPSREDVAAYLASLRATRLGAYARLRDAAAGEALVAALRLLTEEPRAVAAGAEAVRALATRAAAAAALAGGGADAAAAAAAADLGSTTSTSTTSTPGVSAAIASAAGVALACSGVRAVADEVTPKQLASWLRFPSEWGPTEWGPLPYLPDDDALVARMERQWGDLQKHAARNAGGPLLCTQRGGFLVAGLQLGNVFLGVQPALGLEGDPMRLLFERDLTPHPQYAAFYRWLAVGGWEGGAGGVAGSVGAGAGTDAGSAPRQPADAVLTFGMHGTHEWLPGSPLGTTALSWPDALLGDLPNLYVYAANNPSESIVAKRRGFGTLVSHNVPAYGRAGLYKHLSSLKELIGELREAEAEAARGGGGGGAGGDNGEGGGSNSNNNGNDDASVVAAALRVPVADALLLSGVQQDLTYLGEEAELRLARLPAGADRRAAAEAEAAAAAVGGRGRVALTPENVEAEASPAAFSAYCSRLYGYLLELESRLFSEGLHAIGGDGGGDGGEEEEEAAAGAAAAGAAPSASSSSSAASPAAPSVAPRTLAAYLSAYFGDDRLPPDAALAVASAPREGGVEAARAALERVWSAAGGGGGGLASAASSSSATPSSSSAPAVAEPDAALLLRDAVELRDALAVSARAEVSGLLRGLSGGHVPAGLGGDLLRDGPGVLPTGRNIFATDPYRMPSPSADARGAKAAAAVLAQHRAANGGSFPETVTVNLWGLDAIKTRGESVAMVLHFVGARVVKEGTGRVARFELIPLDQLTFDDPITGEKGVPRPRVDVVCSMSGIFRDAFQNVVDLLDDLFQRAAAAEEEAGERNYVKKHALEIMMAGGGGEAGGLISGNSNGSNTNANTNAATIDAATAARRIFSNPAGDYGSMVNERVGQGNWQDGEELGSTWAARNAFSYGRGGERGVARPEVLQSLLSRVDRVVQCVDSVEYGLTDIQEYYANTGGLLRAARDARSSDLKRRAAGGDAAAAAVLAKAAEAAAASGGGGADPSSSLVACSVVESFAAEPLPRDLDAVLRAEYRTKLLNPKWAEAMVAQGSGGAYEVGQRFTAMVGWGGTSGFRDKWAWDQAARTYALDEGMASRLRRANPQAFKNVLARCLEAAGRGLWDADAGELERLRELYAEMDDELEGVGSGGGGGGGGKRK